MCALCHFGSNNHRDRPTYAFDIHLMTSRELTSGFDFCSRGYLCMAVIHLPIKFDADIFIQSGVRHFSEIQDGGRRHLVFSVYANLAIPACW